MSELHYFENMPKVFPDGYTGPMPESFDNDGKPIEDDVFGVSGRHLKSLKDQLDYEEACRHGIDPDPHAALKAADLEDSSPWEGLGGGIGPTALHGVVSLWPNEIPKIEDGSDEPYVSRPEHLREESVELYIRSLVDRGFSASQARAIARNRYGK